MVVSDEKIEYYKHENHEIYKVLLFEKYIAPFVQEFIEKHGIPDTDNNASEAYICAWNHMLCYMNSSQYPELGIYTLGSFKLTLNTNLAMLLYPSKKPASKISIFLFHHGVGKNKLDLYGLIDMIKNDVSITYSDLDVLDKISSGYTVLEMIVCNGYHVLDSIVKIRTIADHMMKKLRDEMEDC